MQYSSTRRTATWNSCSTTWCAPFKKPRAEPLLLALALLLAIGCGKVLPQGGAAAPSPTPANITKVAWQAADLIPADLDLVLRLDLSKLRAHLGPDAANEITERALDQAGSQGLARAALARAEVVWLGLRTADIEYGDRIMAVRTAGDPLAPDSIAWRRSSTSVENIWRYDLIDAAERGASSQIFTLGKRAAIFVSPVERDSVERILTHGPDEKRGQPAARGLLSLDYHPQRTSHAIQKRYPSLAALASGVSRLRAVTVIHGDELRIEGRLSCHSKRDAQRTMRFIETIRNTAKQLPRYAHAVSRLELNRADQIIEVNWALSPQTVHALLSRFETTDAKN